MVRAAHGSPGSRRPTIEGNLRGFDSRSSTRLGEQAAERDTKLGRLEQAVPLDGELLGEQPVAEDGRGDRRAGQPDPADELGELEPVSSHLETDDGRPRAGDESTTKALGSLELEDSTGNITLSRKTPESRNRFGSTKPFSLGARNRPAR